MLFFVSVCVSTGHSAASLNPPTLTGAVAADGEVALNWSAVSGAKNYWVRWGSASGSYSNNIQSGNVQSYTVSGLANGQTYYFAVAATGKGSKVSVDSNELSATPQTSSNPPAAPTLNSANPGDTQVSLTWSAVSGADGYNIKYGSTSGSYTVTQDVAQVTNFVVTSLTNGTDYYFVISAYNSVGEGLNSNELSATPVVGSQTGSISHDIWENISGSAVTDLTSHANYPDSPTFSDTLTSFEGPSGYNNSYGSRIRGFIHPPATGNYTFWVSSDDQSELYLSADANPANKSLIANVPTKTKVYQWAKFAQQQSTAIFLTAGETYYIETLHKEDKGGDHIEVAWQIPGGSQEVIPGTYLTIFTNLPANQTPSVEAGVDQTITLPDGVTLNATVTDDGLPNPPGALTYQWSQLSGPGTVTFSNANTEDTSATFSAAGTFVLQLLVDDSDLNVSDTLTVTVQPQPPQNQAPSVEAGVDQTITLPDGVTLNATVTDDGLPNPPGAVTTQWSMASGLGSVTFGSATQIDTTASFSAAGLFVLRLTADDGNLNNFDELTITVSDPSLPTLTNAAGGDAQIYLGWASVPGATGYNVKYGTTSGNYTTTIDAGNVTNQTVSGLTNGTPYYFVITSYDLIQQSANSNELSSTPTNVGTFVSGQYNGAESWTLTGSPYHVVGGIFVNGFASITIDPGVEVIVEGPYQILFYGRLVAQGTNVNPIVFRSGRAMPSPGDWVGLKFDSGSNGNVIDYVNIRHADKALHLVTSSPTITNSHLENNTIGIYAHKASHPIIDSNIIENNTQYGIALISEISAVPIPAIHNNTLTANGIFNLFTGFIGVNVNNGFVINVENNWWGSADPVEISATIWDYYDSFYRPKMDYSPYLANPPGFIINISDIAVTNNFFDPLFSEAVQINYTIDTAADITIEIYEATVDSSGILSKGNKVRTLLAGVSRTAAAHSESWDGLDDLGQPLPKDIYVFKIIADNGAGLTGRYDPIEFVGTEPTFLNTTATPSAGSFNPYKGERLKVTYDLSAPALVSFGYAFFVNYLDDVPRSTTGNVEYWDGRETDGVITALDNVPFDVQAKAVGLQENVMVIQARATTLDVPTLFSDPYIIRPLYNEITKITYAINEPAAVTVSIFSQDATELLVTLEPSVSKSAGTYTLSWDGKMPTGEVIDVEGDYRIRVEVTDSNGISFIRDGNITILY